MTTLTGCTSGQAAPPKPTVPSGTAGATGTVGAMGATPSATQRPYDTMPARPTGEAAPTDGDRALLRVALRRPYVPAAYEIPADDAVAVIHRVDAENGELAWMPDGRTFCFVLVRRGMAASTCGPLPEEAPAPGLLLKRAGEPDQALDQGKEVQARMVSFVMAEGGSRRFDHVKRASDAGPVNQAVARFPSGRMVTFLTFDRPYGPVDTEAEICSTDRTVCFPAHP
ncbi:hypothetical protein [Streptomyces sp. WM6372]|uniref:hypothetical protein n=1 Tax=Streptomyces sp. WM6372 TaxID=1415555 RepID=UPI000A457E64|nr:hypothetical protein [Streptomyces sp. WM6372]